MSACFRTHRGTTPRAPLVTVWPTIEGGLPAIIVHGGEEALGAKGTDVADSARQLVFLGNERAVARDTLAVEAAITRAVG